MLIIQLDNAVNLKKMLQNDHILAKIGADTADSEPMFIPCSAEDDDDRESLPGGLAGARVGGSGLAESKQPITLQVNMRSKALAEIYIMHSFAQLCSLKNIFQNLQKDFLNLSTITTAYGSQKIRNDKFSLLVGPSLNLF